MALWLGAACKRAPIEPSAVPTPDLPPPPPSSSLVITPLDTASTGYTNEMQAANLRRETAEMDIRHISKHYEEGEQPRSGPPPLLSDVEKKERLEQLRDMTRQFTRMRLSIDGAHDKSVTLPGNTAIMIPRPTPGGPLGIEENEPTRENPIRTEGPKIK